MLPPPPRVAIVGTRSSDREAEHFTHGIAQDLAGAGVSIVSGGARGIDRAAHLGALDASGQTVAVLASGFDPPYPRAHSGLFRRIASHGALLTEAEDGAPPVAHRFLKRNRIIAALSDAVIVVQAPARSGALSTARHAKSMGIPVFSVPGAPWQVRSHGGIALLRGGARICTSAADVLSVFAEKPASVPLRPDKGDENQHDFELLDEGSRRVLRVLRGRALLLDEVASTVGLPVSVVLGTLTALELAGRVESRGGGRYGLVHPRQRQQ